MYQDIYRVFDLIKHDKTDFFSMKLITDTWPSGYYVTDRIDGQIKFEDSSFLL